MTAKAFPRRAGASVAKPITLTEALTHLREVSDGGDQDAYIQNLITVACEACESCTERTMISTPWRLVLDGFPAPGVAIELRQSPIIAVQAVTYIDAAGAVQTMAGTDYMVDTASEPGRLMAAPGVSWPVTQAGTINTVTVQYTAGFGTTAASVPMQLKQWMLCAIQHMYDERGWDVPDQFAPGLINPYRILGL